MTPHIRQALSSNSASFQFAATNVCALVRELRQLMNLTQEQFAAKIGVTVVTINRWENDRAKPLPLALRQIKTLLITLTESQLDSQRVGAQRLLNQYFSNDEPKH